eukprot:PhM_4_TR13309/c2_g1_i1/m.77021
MSPPPSATVSRTLSSTLSATTTQTPVQTLTTTETVENTPTFTVVQTPTSSATATTSETNTETDTAASVSHSHTHTPTHHDTDTHRPVDGQHDGDLHGDGYSGVRYSLPHLAVDGNNVGNALAAPYGVPAHVGDGEPDDFGEWDHYTESAPVTPTALSRSSTPEPSATASAPTATLTTKGIEGVDVETPSTTLTVGATLSGVLTQTRTPGARDQLTRTPAATLTLAELEGSPSGSGTRASDGARTSSQGFIAAITISTSRTINDAPTRDTPTLPPRIALPPLETIAA